MADRTSSSITVAAARPTIMGVIADFETYPEWATGIKSAVVLAAGPDNRPERVRFSLDAGAIRDSYVLAYAWDGDAAVRWQLAEAGSVVTEMSGEYRLSEASGSTQVTYELAVSARIPLGPFKRRAEKTIIDTALKGLKSRAESVQAAGRG